MIGFMTNARMNVIIDGRTLDEMGAEMVDSVSVWKRRSNWLASYDSCSAYIAEMKGPDKYAYTLFVYGSPVFHNVSVRIISDINDEPQLTLLTPILTSGEHYNASRQIAPTNSEEHSLPLSPQQDASVFEVADLIENDNMGSTDTNTTVSVQHFPDAAHLNRIRAPK